MVTHKALVAHYSMALHHWRAHPAVREHATRVGLNRRMYCELFATRHLDASAWTSGTELDGNQAYDQALRHHSLSVLGQGPGSPTPTSVLPPLTGLQGAWRQDQEAEQHDPMGDRY